MHVEGIDYYDEIGLTEDIEVEEEPEENENKVQCPPEMDEWTDPNMTEEKEKELKARQEEFNDYYSGKKKMTDEEI